MYSCNIIVDKPSISNTTVDNDIDFSQHQNVTFITNQTNYLTIHLPVWDLYTKYKARYVVFVYYKLQYPLMSYIHQIKNRRQNAISIRAYDENYNLIEVKDLTEGNRLGLRFYPNFNLTYCYSYGDKQELEHKGIISNHLELKNNKLLCVSTHFAQFLIGNIDIGGHIYPSSMKYWLIAIIVILSIICIGGIVLYIIEIRKRPRTHSLSMLSGPLVTK